MTEDTEHQDGWLLETDGFYWRPLAAGYTGIRDKAGRYSLNEMKTITQSSGGWTVGIHVSDAPEFTSNCDSDVKWRYLLEMRNAQDEEIARLRDELEQCKMLLDGYRSVRSIELYKDLQTLQDVQVYHDTYKFHR